MSFLFDDDGDIRERGGLQFVKPQTKPEDKPKKPTPPPKPIIKKSRKNDEWERWFLIVNFIYKTNQNIIIKIKKGWYKSTLLQSTIFYWPSNPLDIIDAGKI